MVGLNPLEQQAECFYISLDPTLSTRKRTFLTNIFWHTTDIISDNLLRELDDRELEMEQRIFDQQFKDVIYSSNPNKLVRRYKKAKNSKSKKVRYDYSTNVVEPDNKSKMKELNDEDIHFGYP